nr:hypothetical protein [uncultured Rhodopila sp.]
MLELTKVNEVVAGAASAVLRQRTDVRRVLSEPAVDGDGAEVLHITIVLDDGGAESISGDMALDTLVGVERALRAANEERFPIIEYATEEELRSIADTES